MRRAPQNLNTRPLKLDDAPLFAKLEALCFHSPWTAEAWSTFLCRKTSLAFGIDDGPRSDLPKPDLHCAVMLDGVWPELEVITLMTHPHMQRQGLAETLMTYVCHNITPLKYTSLYLEVSDQNTAAQNLYNKIGFDVYATRKGYYGTETGRQADALQMRKALKQTTDK